MTERIAAGQVIYLHCWGGHGRAGVVASIVLGLIYNYTAERCMELVQKMHDHRICPLGVPSPQTLEQREQVIRVLQSDLGKKCISEIQNKYKNSTLSSTPSSSSHSSDNTLSMDILSESPNYMDETIDTNSSSNSIETCDSTICDLIPSEETLTNNTSLPSIDGVVELSTNEVNPPIESTPLSSPETVSPKVPPRRHSGSPTSRTSNRTIRSKFRECNKHSKDIHESNHIDEDMKSVKLQISDLTEAHNSNIGVTNTYSNGSSISSPRRRKTGKSPRRRRMRTLGTDSKRKRSSSPRRPIL